MHINEKNRTPKLAEPDEGPSKSELKRQMTERQKLAEVLAALSSDALKTIPLDEAIKTAIAETNKIKSFEAIRRHKQYLGKLMRFLDDEELEAIWAGDKSAQEAMDSVVERGNPLLRRFEQANR